MPSVTIKTSLSAAAAIGLESATVASIVGSFEHHSKSLSLCVQLCLHGSYSALPGSSHRCVWHIPIKLYLRKHRIRAQGNGLVGNMLVVQCEDLSLDLRTPMKPDLVAMSVTPAFL